MDKTFLRTKGNSIMKTNKALKLVSIVLGAIVGLGSITAMDGEDSQHSSDRRPANVGQIPGVPPHPIPDETYPIKSSSLHQQGSSSPDNRKDRPDGDKSPFDWQNERHYKELVEVFETLSERELNSITQKLCDCIYERRRFFRDCYNNLIPQLALTIFESMKDHCLTEENFRKEEDSNRSSQQQNNSSIDEEVSANERTNACVMEINHNLSIGESKEDEEGAFEKWQLQKIREMLGLNFNSIETLSHNKISLKAIKNYLRYLKEGNNRSYNWLIRDLIDELDFNLIQDFIDKISKEFEVSNEILNSILGDLWFDYGWEEEDITDRDFISKTCIKTLQDFRMGAVAQDLKSRVRTSLLDAFIFNPDDFTNLSNIKGKYNELAQNGDWKSALVVWSIYTTYRKLFIEPKKGFEIEELADDGNAFTNIALFNKNSSVNNRLIEALTRAREVYTKVYPHPDTTEVVYGAKNKSKIATLNLSKALEYLKRIGKDWERKRKTKGKKEGKENVFVPLFYFVVSNQPHTKDGEHGRIFIDVPLTLSDLPRRPLTCSSEDKVFGDKFDMNNKTSYYFNAVRRDVVGGKKIMGLDEDQSKIDLEKTINNKGLCCPHLVHSERVLIELSRCPAYVESMCETLVQQLQEIKKTTGCYKVYGATLLAYSTNTVCKYCTPSIISLQNSHDESGFLGLIVMHLNKYAKQGFRFKTRGYNPQDNSQDFNKFHLNTFVTASINFDEQANDLADKGQHQHKKNNKPPKGTHNPHAKLFFQNNEIDIHSSPRINGLPDSQQHFFYEFVGKDVHVGSSSEADLEFTGALFSSGSKEWATSYQSSKLPPF